MYRENVQDNQDSKMMNTFGIMQVNFFKKKKKAIYLRKQIAVEKKMHVFKNTSIAYNGDRLS